MSLGRKSRSGYPSNYDINADTGLLRTGTVLDGTLVHIWEWGHRKNARS